MTSADPGAGREEGRSPSFIESVRERLLRLDDMDRPLRAMTLAAFGSIVLAALFIAARDVPAPLLAVANSEVLPVPIFGAAVALLAVSEAYLLAGALHAHGAVRLVAVAVYTLAMYLTIPQGGAADVVWLLLLIGVWATSLTLWIGDRRNRGPRPERTAGRRLRLTDFFICLALTAAFFLNGVVGSSPAWFSSEIEAQLVWLSLVLACALLFAGTDFADWARLAAEGLAQLVDRRAVPVAPAAVLALASVAVLLDKLLRYGWTDLASQAIEMLLLIGLAVGAVAVARRRRGSPRPSVPAILLVIAVLIVLVLLVNLLPALLPGTTADRLAGLEALGWAPILIAAVLVWFRTRSETVRAGAMLLFFAGVVFILESGIGSGPRTFNAPLSAFAALNRGGLQAGLALASLVVVGISLAGPGGRRAADPLLRPLLELTVALQILSWLWDAFNGAIVGGARFSIVQATVIIVALFWDVLTSGESVTNVHGRRMPRHARVLVYLGYVMLIACAILFFSSVRGLDHRAAESWFESEVWPQLGIQRLGVPLVLVLFILRVARGRRQQVERPAEPAPEPA